MSDSEPKVKVTDKRMFTADGELREDFRHLEETAGSPASAAGEELAEAAGPAPEAETAAAEPQVAAAEPPTAGEANQAPGSAPAGAGRLPEKASFYDLLGALAEPVALFLGDARLPDGRSAEDLEAARFHIDLLEIVQQKTTGNLSAEEAALLEDLLYRLRLRYVQKTG